MQDLEDAAQEAVDKARQLESELEKTHAGLEELTERITRASAELEADWSALDQAADSLLAKVRSLKAELDQEGQEAAQSLQELQARLGSGHQDAAQELEGARQQVAGFEEEARAAAPEVAATGDQTEGAMKALAEQAGQVADGAEQAFQSVRDFLENQVVPALQGMQQAVRDAAHRVVGEVFEGCQQSLQESRTLVESHLDDVDDLLEDSFQEAERHVAEAVSAAAEQCGEAHRDALTQAKELATTLEATVAHLAAAVQEKQSEVDLGRSSLSDDLTTTEQELATMTKALLGTRELLARFTYVA